MKKRFKIKKIVMKNNKDKKRKGERTKILFQSLEF